MRPDRYAACQYCLARGSWKEAELRILHRAVKFESDLEALQEEARVIPAVHTKPSGDTGEHPVHVAVRSRLKALQSELRMVGLQCSAALTEISARKTTGVRHNGIVLLGNIHCWQDAMVLLADKLR